MNIKASSKHVIFLLLSISSCLFLNCQEVDMSKHQLIGKVFNKITDFDFLKGYAEAEGILIGPVKEKIAFRRFSNDKHSIILCTKYLGPKASEVLAVLNIGSIEKNVQICMGNCQLNGKANGNIVALIRPASRSFPKTILKAWKVELDSNRFMQISNSGIDCIMDSDD